MILLIDKDYLINSDFLKTLSFLLIYVSALKCFCSRLTSLASIREVLLKNEHQRSLMDGGNTTVQGKEITSKRTSSVNWIKQITSNKLLIKKLKLIIYLHPWYQKMQSDIKNVKVAAATVCGCMKSRGIT